MCNQPTHQKDTHQQKDENNKGSGEGGGTQKETPQFESNKKFQISLVFFFFLWTLFFRLTTDVFKDKTNDERTQLFRSKRGLQRKVLFSNLCLKSVTKSSFLIALLGAFSLSHKTQWMEFFSYAQEKHTTVSFGTCGVLIYMAGYTYAVVSMGGMHVPLNSDHGWEAFVLIARHSVFESVLMSAGTWRT